MTTFGPQILARSLSVATSGAGRYAHGNRWQYHPRSDRHSKIACWGIFFDLMLRGTLVSQHVGQGKVAFGINHRMVDFRLHRKKDLDLVICRRSSPDKVGSVANFADMVDAYGVVLSRRERAALDGLPSIPLTGVHTALIALEAKAAFTEFGKARPRLYDELNSSQLTVHGDTDSAIAAGLVLINASPTFVSPLRNGWYIGSRPTQVTTHRQPDEVAATIAKIAQLPRRSALGDHGFDAVGVTVLSCANDGREVELRSTTPAPAVGDTFHYDSFIERIETIYATRFGAI